MGVRAVQTEISGWEEEGSGVRRLWFRVLRGR